MTKVVGVRFRNVGKIYYFSPKNYEIKTGDHVIVETARGIEYGKVVLATVIGVVSSGWVKTLGMGNFATLLVSAILFFGGYSIVLTVLKEPLVWEIENQVFTKIKGMIK